ncbi:membrane protein insertase YidC [Paroceanicella profunda]|uniref:Membrane protein insertase YidC n=1 Tax=Paroceanicella profunda TaxID=2579971 RepID=A0A5B8FWY5_9RHOB|nr:membrane protein insertase YidC [Paroceanicella profunda]QDL90573.1 membrane protein insertase YidC [Paroceanicella profunda]
MDNQNRNMILAIALSLVVFIGWYAIFPPEPPQDPAPAEQTAAQSQEPVAPTLPQDPVAVRAEALGQTRRIKVESPLLSGSISVKGGRIDDLHLNAFKDTLEPDSDTVVLFSPTGSAEPYFATYGWLVAPGTDTPTPNPNTPWQVEGNDTLTPSAPVTLSWDNGAGLVFRRVISLDDRYMFTIEQTVENTSDAAVSLVPYGYVARRGTPPDAHNRLVHEGGIGASDGKLTYPGWSDMEDFESVDANGSHFEKVNVTETGWIGLTGKYFMAALVPQFGQPFEATYRYETVGDQPQHLTEVRLPTVQVAAGDTASITTRLFAGAKEVKTLQHYRDTLNIPQFDDAVDWGWFYFLTKPIFEVLHWLQSHIGNMGFSIILLTFGIKALLFPLAYKSYVSMSKMKKLQPEMEALKKRAGDDRMKLQQEMMALYKKEKVNPAAGCLPILLQIPVFFSLYKVLTVTLEMRHAPFIWWIHDLSAPDPTSIVNLFGLLPWPAPEAGSMFAIISIGVFPIVMGVTMWLQQKLNPAPADATQAMIFAWMPWVFMFMLGSFASGLVIYWCANNILTFTQQYLIMRSQGVDVDVFGNVKKSFKRKKKDA